MRAAELPRLKGRGVEFDPADINTETFFSRVVIGSGDECWLWRGAPQGAYGRYRIYRDRRQTSVAAHRVSYVLRFGLIAPGVELDHKCRNTLCVNPHHLEPVTPQLNIARSTGCTADRAKNWIAGLCGNGHILDVVGLHKCGDHWTCAQCGRDRVARYKARKAAKGFAS